MENKTDSEKAYNLGKEALTVGEEAIAEMAKVSIEATEKVGEAVEEVAVETIKVAEVPIKKAKSFWVGLGPGLITGASDDDPSGMVTYSQTGAKFGTQLIWMSALTLPMMAAVQEMCARIGMVTGRGLASNIRSHFPKYILFITSFSLLLANSFNIGADLGALAKSTQLLAPFLPFWFLIIGFTVLSLLLQILIPYEKYARYLKYLALILLVYIATAFIIEDFPWRETLQSFITPSLKFGKDQLLLICALLGTTISPYLFFWQTSQEVEEEIMNGHTTLASRQGTNKAAIKKMRIDVWSGMILSNLVMFFIIAVTAATLHKNGITDIQTAEQVASALRPLAGDSTYLLFALGVLGTGLLAIPVLAGSASYAISESFNWKEGLYRRFKQASAFYGVIILSMLIGLGINFIGIDPIKALIYSALFNGLVAPLVLALIVILSSNKKIMGEWSNSKPKIAFGWFITAVMALSAAGAIYAIF